MPRHRRYHVTGTAATLMFAGVLSLAAQANNPQTPVKEYVITVAPPGGPTPRLEDGHPDFTGLWLPNSAGQGVSGRDGVDPAARRQFDARVTPEERPPFQPWAAAKIKAMTPVEAELSKPLSIACRGVPPSGCRTLWDHAGPQAGLLAQMFEVSIPASHPDGRTSAYQVSEPLFNGEGVGRWDGDTPSSTGSVRRTDVHSAERQFHSDQLHVTERYICPSMNYLMCRSLRRS